MIAPNSLACQKEGVQGEGEEEVGDQTETQTSSTDVPKGLFRSGVLDVRSRRKHGRW